jgi:hypothetical protein
LPIPTSLASERIARKPAQNGREAGDVVTGLTCESPGERPGRLEAHPFRDGRLHLTPRTFGSSPLRSDACRRRASRLPLENHIKAPQTGPTWEADGNPSTNRDRAPSATLGQLIEGATRTKNQKKTASGKSDGEQLHGLRGRTAAPPVKHSRRLRPVAKLQTPLPTGPRRCRRRHRRVQNKNDLASCKNAAWGDAGGDAAGEGSGARGVNRRTTATVKH